MLTVPQSPVVPLVILLLLAGGGMLLWGASQGTALPARRFQLVREGGGQRGGPKPAEWDENTQAWYAQGLTVEERWQIARGFSKIGLEPATALLLFIAMRLVLAVGGGALAYAKAPSSSPMFPLIAGAIAAICGWLAPIMTVDYKLKQHRASVASALPNALELMAICVGVGLSLEAGFQRVAAEIKTSSPALADEFSLTWAEITISPSREQALANLAKRVNLPSVKNVISTLIQSLKFGTPLAQSLRNASAEMRSHQMIEMEERANRLPAMLTVPVMLFIMPTMFIIVGGPAAIRLMETFH